METTIRQNQPRLLDSLIRATDEVMVNVPGFISANLHRNLDGLRVVNYAQWANEDVFKAMPIFIRMKWCMYTMSDGL